MCSSDLNPKSLLEHPKNRNKHPKDQVKRLFEMLKYYGWRHPIIVDADDNKTIIVGRGRQMSAIHGQLEKVPVVYQKFDNDDQKYAFIQADNAISEWSQLDLSSINFDLADLDPSFNIDMLGLKDFVIEPADKFEAQDLDAVTGTAKETICKLGDLWKLGNHFLLCADANDPDSIDKVMQGQTPEIVFTDPPYGIGLDKSGQTLGKSKKYDAVLNDHDNQTAVDAFGLASNLGAKLLFFWGANHYSHILPASSCWLVWDKQGGKRVTFADCELCYTNLKKSVRMFTHIWDGFRRDSEKGDARLHPTQKPVKLITDIFDYFKDETEPLNIVLDMFGGSGSTLIACEKMKKQCRMIELSPNYCDMIIRRFEQMTGEKAELKNG